MNYYVTSDPHGHYYALRFALTEKGFFDDSEDHKLMILGDVMDRGEQPVEMQKFLLELMDEGRLILIRGNHEDLFVDLATKDRGLAMEHHVHNGTFQTALDLTGFSVLDAMTYPEDFSVAMRGTTFYRTIIPSALPYYETEQYIFTHGYLPCRSGQRGTFVYRPDWRESEEYEWRGARWINGMLAAQTAKAEKTVVVGHWHTSYGHSKLEHNGPEFGQGAVFTPYYGDGIIALDACTVQTGMVNVIVIEDA